MRSTVLALVVLGASAAAAHAGGPVVVDPDPQPVVAQPTAAHDWSGFYAGLSYGRSSGDLDFDPAPSQSLDSGKARGVHLGYQWQTNALVYGAELSYLDLKDNFVTGFACCEVTRTVDIKGRLGYAANRALFYGVLGYSLSNYDEGLGDWDPKGAAYGLGVDFAATDRLTVGLEYLSRDLSGDNPDGSPQSVEIDLDTFSLRVGFSF